MQYTGLVARVSILESGDLPDAVDAVESTLSGSNRDVEEDDGESWGLVIHGEYIWSRMSEESVVVAPLPVTSWEEVRGIEARAYSASARPHVALTLKLDA